MIILETICYSTTVADYITYCSPVHHWYHMDNGQSHHNVGLGEYKVRFHNGIDLHSKPHSNLLVDHVDRFLKISFFKYSLRELKRTTKGKEVKQHEH